MSLQIPSHFLAAAALTLACAWPATALPGRHAQVVQALDRMMIGLAPQSAEASATIRAVYREYLDLLVLDRYDDMEDALANGGLAPLPPDSQRFNVAPRLDGPSPIGEKDLDNQVSYIAARPATIGALLEVASRVKSGPVEVTSLVRHLEYQDALKGTNANANTSVPMHTMGLAFDIALINTPLQTVYEIRDVLRKMRDAGDILFIGERRQLVFHVVPQPSRLGYFTQVYTRALRSPSTFPDAPAVVHASAGRGRGTPLVPSVNAEVIAVGPTAEFLERWWAVAEPDSDVTIEVFGTEAPLAVAAPSNPRPSTVERSAHAVAFPSVAFMGLLTVLWHAARRRAASGRQDYCWSQRVSGEGSRICA